MGIRLRRQCRGAARHRRGTILAAVLGVMHFEKSPRRHGPRSCCAAFGIPKFQLVPIITMCIVMIVVMIESLGMFLALGEITGKAISRDALTRGLRADGVGTLLAGCSTLFLYIVLAECRSVGITGVRSRWVTIAGAASCCCSAGAKDGGAGRSRAAGVLGGAAS